MEQSPVVTSQSTDDEGTLADSGFYWRERGGVKVLVCSALEDAGFVNGFSTRLGGISPFPDGDLNLAGFDEDTAANIEENRRRFLTVFHGDFKLATAWQVHGAVVRTIADARDVAASDSRADALISQLPGVLTGVKTADCVPILIADPVTGVYGAVHAGWRGTVASIVTKAVAEMAGTYGASPDRMIAALGPAASGRQYEVGHDVRDAFAENFRDSHTYFTPRPNGHAFVDLHAANRDQLIACGVRKANVFMAPLCTIERTDLFFSYRAEKQRYGKTGRLLAVIGLRE